MFKVVRKQEAVKREITTTYSAYNYISKDISPNISLAVTEANFHSEEEATQYDRIYYVLGGLLKLTFPIGEVSLNPEDSIFIQKGTAYKIEGTFKAIIVNQPAFGT